jgi:hypothetical protein
VEILLLLVGALVLRGSGEQDEDERPRAHDRLTEA